MSAFGDMTRIAVQLSDERNAIANTLCLCEDATIEEIIRKIESMQHTLIDIHNGIETGLIEFATGQEPLSWILDRCRGALKPNEVPA